MFGIKIIKEKTLNQLFERCSEITTANSSLQRELADKNAFITELSAQLETLSKDNEVLKRKLSRP